MLGEKWRVHCPGCGWRGVRTARQCECYDEWRMYCRPNRPGPGCPSGVTWPCPRCGPNVERPILGPGTPMQRVWSTVRGVAPVRHRQPVTNQARSATMAVQPPEANP